MVFKTKISNFIKQNFRPAEYNTANVTMSTEEFLDFLFTVFPKDCISDYDLVDIMERQGFVLRTHVVERIVKIEKDKREIVQLRKSLAVTWSMRSDFDLETEILG
jgi:hypothetical protein